MKQSNYITRKSEIVAEQDLIGVSEADNVKDAATDQIGDGCIEQYKKHVLLSGPLDTVHA